MAPRSLIRSRNLRTAVLVVGAVLVLALTIGANVVQKETDVEWLGRLMSGLAGLGWAAMFFGSLLGWERERRKTERLEKELELERSRS